MAADRDTRVATLVVAVDSVVTDAQVAQLQHYILQYGGQVSGLQAAADRRAVDLFFTGQEIDAPYPAIDGADLFIQNKATRRKRVLVADMESTIIRQEMLDEMAAEIGVGEQVAAITRRAMNGELDFAGALSARLGLLKGQPESLLAQVAARMTLSPGAEALVRGMKRAGGTCWLVSGGFDVFVKIIAERLGFDGYFANRLDLREGRIMGEIAPPLLDGAAKREHLAAICAEQGATLADAVAVGDGANDVPMLAACAAAGGLGVAYRAKPAVRAQVRDQINAGCLDALLYAQGLAD